MKQKKNKLFEDIHNQGKTFPQAVDFEEQVLGAIIDNDKLYNIVGHFLTKEMFYKEYNQIIWNAIDSLNNDNSPIDILLVTNKLKETNELETVGGAYYLTQLSKKNVNPYNIEYHARIVHQKWLQRKLIEISSKITNKAYDDTNDIFDLIEDAENNIKKLDVKEQESIITNTKDATKKTLEEILLYNTEDNDVKPYYNTGNKMFDDIISFSSGLSLWAGSSGIGKSIFNIFLITSLLKKHKDISVLWYVIDHEDEDKIIKRFISQITGFTDNILSGKKGKMSNEDLQIVLSLKDTFDHYDIEFVNKPTKISYIRKHFNRFCEKRPERFNILIIDNIMRLLDNRDAFHQLAIDENIANTLADIRDDTKKYNSHILAMHHFSKEQSSNLNIKQAFRPSNSHIRGSSRYYDIMEQIVLLNRPGNFENLLNDMKDQEDILKHLFITEVTKNSYGETGTIRWWCDLSVCKFKEIE